MWVCVGWRAATESMNRMTKAVKSRKQMWLRVHLSAVLFLLTFYFSALIVLTVEIVNYMPGWMIESETRAIVVATAEPIPTSDLQTLSPKTTSLPLLKNAPIITLNYSSHSRWNLMLWPGCLLRIRWSISQSYNSVKAVRFHICKSVNKQSSKHEAICSARWKRIKNESWILRTHKPKKEEITPLGKLLCLSIKKVSECASRKSAPCWHESLFEWGHLPPRG